MLGVPKYSRSFSIRSVREVPALSTSNTTTGARAIVMRRSCGEQTTTTSG